MKHFFLYFRWNCQKDLSVSGPAVLTMEIPTGYFIDTEELFRIQSEGYNAWSVDEKVVIFFHRVRKIIAIFSYILEEFRLTPNSDRWLK